ncbi:MAG: cell envelope integrity protein TolA [Cellvibrionaceae bacterium]
MSYLPATLASVIAHGLLILLILKGWEYTHPPEPPKPPAYIKATLLDLKTQGKQGAPEPKPKPKPQPKPTPPEPKVDKAEVEKKRLQEKLAQQKAKQEAKKKEQQKAKQKQIALEKAKKEKEEKLKREKEKKAKEKKLAEERKKKQQDERNKLLEQEFQDDLAREEERLQAEALAQQTENDLQLSQSYEDLIQQRVQQNWSRPPSARNDMEAYVTIKMVPTGEIIDAVIKKSSGNGAYDRSAIQAVKKTRQIPELKDLPNRIFEKRFRQLTLTFKPQDLRQ